MLIGPCKFAIPRTNRAFVATAYASRQRSHGGEGLVGDSVGEFIRRRQATGLALAQPSHGQSRSAQAKR